MELLIMLLGVMLPTLGWSQNSGALTQCQPSSQRSGQLYFPNIPDFYFDIETARSINSNGTSLDTAKQFTTHIFTVPPAQQTSCGGQVVGLQYCYRTNTSQVNGMNEGRVFELLHLVQIGDMQFEITKTTQITSVADPSICSPPRDPGGVQQVCCRTTTLNDTDVFQIPSSEYIFGVTNRAYQPLAFLETASEYVMEQFLTSLQIGFPIPSGINFTVQDMERANSPVLLMRFIIDEGLATSESSTDIDTTSSPTDSKNSHSGGQIAAAVVIPVIIIDLALIVAVILLVVMCRAKLKRGKRNNEELERTIQNKLYAKNITGSMELIANTSSTVHQHGDEEYRVVNNELYGESMGPDDLKTSGAFKSITKSLNSLQEDDANKSDVSCDSMEVNKSYGTLDRNTDMKAGAAYTTNNPFLDQSNTQDQLDHATESTDAHDQASSDVDTSVGKDELMELNEAYGTLDRNANLEDMPLSDSVRIVQNTLYEAEDFSVHANLNSALNDTQVSGSEDDDYIYPQVYTNADH